MTPFDAPAAPPSSPPLATAAAPHPGPPPAPEALRDGFGRAIRYLRLSVTDRCDLRCVYCMPERMTFLPRAEVLTLEELERLAGVFIGLGTRKLRLTGGEPLVRKGVEGLFTRLGSHLRDGASGGGLDELTLTTNATRLAAHAQGLAAAGVRRVNVSLDSLDPATYRRLTRGGDLAQGVAGIDAAQAAGLKVKLNVVALARDNRAELAAIVAWAHARGCEVTFIEAMPMGDMGGEVEGDRAGQFLSLSTVREDLAAVWTLTPMARDTGGPARWWRVAETGGALGLITPLSHDFCDTCNRVRLTCTGVLHTCLGQDDATDLRGPLRAGASDAELAALIRGAIAAKPRGHDFAAALGRGPAVARHMSTTGG